MQAWATEARERSGYPGSFVYAYATKANFAEEVVRTALQAGAHHETSASADVVIAHQLWRQGTIPADRYIFCNGSKDRAYLDAIAALRHAGCDRLVPILDSVEELDHLLDREDSPWLFGLRARFAPEAIDPGHPGGERFGLTHTEILAIAKRLAGTPHQIVLYHAMVGSQIEDAAAWEARLVAAATAYCDLANVALNLHMFNFGGGMPTSAYAVDFQFDYVGFLERLMINTAMICARNEVAAPDIVGEFGRYSVASHSVFLLEVGSVKQGQVDQPDWFLLNGSLMVSLPDILIVEGQQFVTLPLDGWERPATAVRLGGRYTCDSDDFFPRAGQPPLMLPSYDATQTNVVAFFGVGAYQQMISGRGGAHHCLTPDMRRIIIEQDDDALVVREVAPQSLEMIMLQLGYPQGEVLEPLNLPTSRIMLQQPLQHASAGDRRPIRESVLASRTPRRRTPGIKSRPITPRDPRQVSAI
jgi:arginine decarboxylase